MRDFRNWQLWGRNLEIQRSVHWDCFKWKPRMTLDSVMKRVSSLWHCFTSIEQSTHIWFSTIGCVNKVQRSGKCKQHGGGATCNYPGCELAVFAKQLCNKHHQEELKKRSAPIISSEKPPIKKQKIQPSSSAVLGRKKAKVAENVAMEMTLPVKVKREPAARSNARSAPLANEKFHMLIRVLMKWVDVYPLNHDFLLVTRECDQSL